MGLFEVYTPYTNTYLGVFFLMQVPHQSHHRKMVRTMNVPYQPIVHSKIQCFKVDITSGTETMLMMHLIQYPESIAPSLPSFALK